MPYILFAQQEGYIKYYIDVDAVDSSEKTLQSVSMMRNSKMELYFAPYLTRVDFTVGTMYSTKIIKNGHLKKAITLIKNPFSKFSMDTDFELASKMPLKDSTVKLVHTGNKKDIIGFQCYELYLIKQSDTTLYWCTKQIATELSGNVISDPNLDGFPMSFSKVDKGVRMTYTASNYRDIIENKETVFSVEIPVDYPLYNPSKN